MQIDRREFLKAAGTGVCLATASGFSATANASINKPNIVLCMADDQGWGDMAYNGHPILKTPQFDAMAAEAQRFDRFYAAAPVCSPTRGSVMTGRHPNRFGCFQWGYTLRPQEITLAEAFKSANYATGHFGKWHLGPVRPGSPVNPGCSGFDTWLSAGNFYDNDPILSRNGKAVQLEGESSMVVVDAALEFIEKHAKADRPFLAVVWFGSPHGPHRAAERDRMLYEDQPKNDRDWLGEITGMDRAFGKLRRALRKLGIHKNTLLWYTSDNGGLRTTSSGGRGKKGQIYEGGLRVPALLEWPARYPGHRTTGMPCVTSDIYPTLLDLVGITMSDQPPLDGISLRPLLEGKMMERPEPIGFWSYPAGGHGVPAQELNAQLLEAQQAGKDIDPDTFGADAHKIKKQYPVGRYPGHAAWLDWPWKLHRIEAKKGIRLELYNLAEDPNEENDLAPPKWKYTDRVKAMKADLEKWQTSVVRSLNGRDYR